ncbi:ScbA/BarX family gamma-butyrolactone biosynthesis protein [Streptomyces eurythermus]|uniref:ScbA/BarX family gamma-butyrolactone biosynthesis protein n=1 Tax=Streptomyces eurythermus TaxID=42237 RepID=UPI0033E08FA1
MTLHPVPTLARATLVADRNTLAERTWTPLSDDDLLALTATVPRQYVHRAAVAEVFLTGWRADGPDSFTVAAQWPRAHAFFTPVAGRLDPLLLAETVRQTGALLAHAEYQVPFGHQFLLQSLSYSVTEEGLRIGAAPADVELKITCGDIAYRSGHLSRMRYHAVLLREGRPVAEAEAAFGCASPAVYRRLRAGAPSKALPLPRALPARAVGREHPQDVVLAAAGRPGRWRLRADTTHPILFDHPVDHVPGMVLLEAARQAAHALRGASRRQAPITMDSVFTRYVEFGSPCYIEAEDIHSAGPGPRVRVRGVQDGAETFSATLTLWSPDGAQDRREGLL